MRTSKALCGSVRMDKFPEAFDRFEGKLDSTDSISVLGGTESSINPPTEENLSERRQRKTKHEACSACIFLANLG